MLKPLLSSIPLDDDSPRRGTKRTKASVLFEWFKTVIKMKMKNYSYFFFVLVSVGITWLLLFDSGVEDDIPEYIGNSFQIVEPTDFEKLCQKYTLYISPDTEDVREYVNKSIQNCTKINYVHDISDSFRLINGNRGIGIELKQSNKSRFLKIYTEYIRDIPISISNVTAYSDNFKVPIVTENSELNTTRTKMFEITTAGIIGFSLSITFALVISYIQISSWMKSGAIQMVCVSGIKISEVWAIFILSDLIPVLLSIISITIILHFFFNASFGLSFIISFFGMLSMFFSAILIIIIFKNRFAICVAFILWSGITILISYTPTFAYIRDTLYNYMEFNWLFELLFPSCATLSLIKNIKSVREWYPDVVATFFNPPTFWVSSNGYLLFCLVTQIVVYVLLFVFLCLMQSERTGSPIIGWRNVFSIRHWKRLFSKNIKLRDFDCAIELKRISKSYRRNRFALHNVNLDIQKGEMVVVIGANGAGKTTLLNIISGISSADSGSLKINGIDTSGLSQVDTNVGFCYQNNVFFDKLNVREHMMLFATIRGLNKEDAEDAINYVSEGLGLQDILNHQCTKLSGGQRRKVSVAVALIGNPTYAVFDEPTAGVDADGRRQIWKFIASQKSTTSIVTSHTIEDAEDFASRVVLLSAGNVLFDGTPQEMREQFNCGYRIRLLGQQSDVNNVDDDIVQNVLDDIRKINPLAVVDEEWGNCIMVPVCDEIPNILEVLDTKKNQNIISGFNILVENLENVLLQIIFSEDASII